MLCWFFSPCIDTWINHRYTYMSPLSWTSLPPPTPSHPSRLSQSTGLSSLHHTANSYWLSVLRMVMYMFSYKSRVALFILKTYLLIWLCQVLVAVCGIFSCGTWDLVPWPGIEPGPAALGTQSLSPWTMRKSPQMFYFLSTLCNIWDLSSPTRDWILAPGVDAEFTTRPPGKV